jgi:Tfp pilus assembly protein PilX
MNKKQMYLKNEQGQALLFVVVALTVAMAIGMSVSTRTISSVRRSTSTDTSSRVYSAAEGGIEWFLNQPTTVLNALSDGNTNSGAECPSGTQPHETNGAACVITYSSATGDNVTSRAIVTVAPFTYNSPTGSPNHYWFYVNSGEVKEVALAGTYNGNMRVCWSSQDSNITPDLYYSYYSDSGIIRKAIIKNQSRPNVNVSETNPVTLTATATGSPYPTLDFTECSLVNIPNGVRGIRFKAMYAPAKVGVFEVDDTLPVQGYTINSIGELFENEIIRTVKRLRVFRSFQYMPAAFDYAIYSDTNLGITP